MIIDCRKAVILLIFLLGYIVCADGFSISDVKYLNTPEGLSSHRVFTIIEDSNGAIWISTKSGVDRYNGNEIKNYTLAGDFYYGDMAGRMIKLYKDNNGEIWAYDNTGRIYKYSTIHDSFNLETKLSEHISGNIMLNSFSRSSNGVQIFGLTKGLFVKATDSEIETILTDIDVNDIIEINKTLLIGTGSGLKIITENKSIQNVVLLDGKNIQTLYPDEENNKLFIGTFNDGLWAMDLTTNKVSHLSSGNEVFSNPIRSILKLNANTLAIGIDGSGIYTIDCTGKNIKLLIDSEDYNDYYLQGNGIYTMMLDRQDNLWTGSYTGGVSFIVLSDSPSKLIKHERGNINSLVNNNVNAIAENVNGDIWYATDRGVSIFSQSGRWKHSLKKSVGVTLCPAGNGNVLLGTYGEGIIILDKDGKTIKRLNKQSGTLTSNNIFSIRKDHSGSFWVGSLDGELINIEENGKLKHSYPISLVLSLAIIDKSTIAAATVDGFYSINTTNHRIEHYASSQEQIHHNVSTYIIPMLFNDDGTVWLGTEGGGLNHYNPVDRKIIKSFKVSDGLPSNDVYSLLKDPLGRIWVSTGNGIAILVDTIVSSLNYLNGIEKEYNKSAGTMLKNGDFIFGGTSGAVRFSPKEINIAEYKAPLRITGFEIDGISEEKMKQLMPHFHNGLKNEKVRLTFNQNSFSFTFESINLRYQKDIAYQYLLEGYDKGWSRTTTGSAVYKNVTPGNYILHLQSVRKSDGKTIDSKLVKIAVAQPWWSSWWALILYVFLLVVTVYFVFRYKWYQLQKRHDDDKIRFFINTAHDIRTPVTLAMAPLEDIKKEEHLSSNAISLLTLALQNIRKLNSIASQLLEFEKFDSEDHLIKPEPVDLREIVQEEIACFQNVCDKKNITLSVVLPDTSACISGDTHLLEMLFDNLMSNACKYTPSGGSIRVILSTSKNKITAEITDTGIGIPVNEQKFIFSEIYRAKNARESQESGTGFGLLQVKRIINLLHGTIEFKSKEGEGSTFTVSFKRIYEEAKPHTRQSPVCDTIDIIQTSFPLETETNNVNKDVTILIVEDNNDLRLYHNKVFKSEYNVIGMPTADEALIYLSTDYPDLIISDVMMPGTQGDDFCRTVKNNPETSGIPVILLTAKTNHDSIVSGLQKGADDYLAKPFSTEILKLKVKGLIQNRNRMRDYLLKKAVVQVTKPTPVRPQDEISGRLEELALSDSDRRFMESVTALILQHMSDTEFSIETLCREMAMSRTLFYSRLKSLTGKAPQEFIRLLRLERAADMLRKGLTVTEVADETGFINTKYFSTIFKKHFGIQPSKFSEDGD